MDGISYLHCLLRDTWKFVLTDYWCCGIGQSGVPINRLRASCFTDIRQLMPFCFFLHLNEPLKRPILIPFQLLIKMWSAEKHNCHVVMLFSWSEFVQKLKRAWNCRSTGNIQIWNKLNGANWSFNDNVLKFDSYILVKFEWSPVRVCVV